MCFEKEVTPRFVIVRFAVARKVHSGCISFFKNVSQIHSVEAKGNVAENRGILEAKVVLLFIVVGRGDTYTLTFTPRNPSSFPSLNHIRIGVCNIGFLVHGVGRSGHSEFLDGPMLGESGFDLIMFEEERDIHNYNRS